MATIQSQISLPTIDKLGAKLPDNLDAPAIAQNWFDEFAKAIKARDTNTIETLLVEDAFWRDMLAMTWEFRTFQGTARITQFLEDILPEVQIENLTLKADTAGLQQPYPDLAWIQAFFSFDTAAGHASGIIRLVPTSTGSWKAHTVFTNLEDLKGFPERIGPLRDALPNHGKWREKREREINFLDTEPVVLVIGGGQSGLDVAARLKNLDIPTLVVEKQPRIGDQWRGRYEALCLHDPVWYDHMPYLPFPPSWPVYTPACKLADWLESYAHAMELNVWTGARITSLVQDEAKLGDDKKQGKGAWTAVIKRSDGKERTFHPSHVVFATGLGGNTANMPKYPGMDEFEGKILHSSEHKSARDHAGKKVVIVGACTSGHDIAQDYHNHGVDVTLYQRSSTYIMTTKNGMPMLLGALYSETAPPTDVADRINASYPNHLLKLVHQRIVKDIAAADRDILDGLTKRGFRLNYGEDGSGFLLLAWKRAGGYYLDTLARLNVQIERLDFGVIILTGGVIIDVGASQLIIDGKIKLKNDSQIERFTKTGIKFENGSELPADVVLFATGFSDARETVRKLCGDKIADQVNPIWGLDDEGEINSVWRWSGVPGLYYMVGNLALCRFHSKHLALQIKAIEEGLFGKRYTA